MFLFSIRKHIILLKDYWMKNIKGNIETYIKNSQIQ